MTPALPPLLLEASPLVLVRSVGLALLGFAALVVVGWFAVVRVRRWMSAGHDDEQAFTLEDLRRFHREGRMTAEEFARAKEAMIGAARAAGRSKAADAARSRRAKGSPIDSYMDSDGDFAADD